MTHEEMLDTAQEREAKAAINPSLLTTLGPNNTVEKDIPEDVEWLDDAFYIMKTTFGLYTSVLKNPLGGNFITGATYDGVLAVSRWHLKCLQDGTLENYSNVVNSGVVSGKL